LINEKDLEEIRHRHELEVQAWKQKIESLDSKYQIQSTTLLDFKEKIEQLSSTNVAEQSKYRNALKDFEARFDISQVTYLKSEKQKEKLEFDNMRLDTANRSLKDSLEKLRTENRKLMKEGSRLSKQIKELRTPKEPVLSRDKFQSFVSESDPDLSELIDDCITYKKRFEKSEQQKEKIQTIMNDCIDKISKHMLTEDGKVIDWKKRFKVMKLQSLKKAERIHELLKENEGLKNNLKAKEISIEKMLSSGVVEYTEKGKKPVKLVLEETSTLEANLKKVECKYQS
jgi:chromosome segregation ATPase